MTRGLTTFAPTDDALAVQGLELRSPASLAYRAVAGVASFLPTVDFRASAVAGEG
jgi:hypothetical protein